MMSTKRQSLWLCAASLLVVLALLTGCFRPAAPDVTPTAGGEEQAVQSDEDVIATARADSTRAAEEVAQETAAAATPTPVVIQPTATVSQPTLEAPTAVPPTAVPEATATTEPEAVVEPTPLPTEVPATETATGQVIHVVQPGEWLYSIARKYGTTAEAIADANGLTNQNQIYPGQKLIIPVSGAETEPEPSGGTTYVVQNGDTLYSIARRFDVSPQALAQYNGISNPNLIYVGQVLQIP